jgi:hypothetical protein
MNVKKKISEKLIDIGINLGGLIGNDLDECNKLKTAGKDKLFERICDDLGEINTIIHPEELYFHHLPYNVRNEKPKPKSPIVTNFEKIARMIEIYLSERETPMPIEDVDIIEYNQDKTRCKWDVSHILMHLNTSLMEFFEEDCKHHQDVLMKIKLVKME